MKKECIKEMLHYPIVLFIVIVKIMRNYSKKEEKDKFISNKMNIPNVGHSSYLHYCG